MTTSSPDNATAAASASAGGPSINNAFQPDNIVQASNPSHVLKDGSQRDGQKSHYRAKEPDLVRLSVPSAFTVESSISLRFSLFGFKEWAIPQRQRCARLLLNEGSSLLPMKNVQVANKQSHSSSQDYEGSFGLTIGDRYCGFTYGAKQNAHIEEIRVYNSTHVVIGILNKAKGTAREELIHVRSNQMGVGTVPGTNLLKDMRKAIRRLRPRWRRCISLKSLYGFSLYECFVSQGYHGHVEVDSQTNAVLTRLYHDYNHPTASASQIWASWIHENLNRADYALQSGDSADNTPTHAYAIRLELRWSVPKILLYSATPIILSLIIGFWFQATHDGDPIAVIQTAWTISSYVVTAGAFALAILAAITQLGGQ